MIGAESIRVLRDALKRHDIDTGPFFFDLQRVGPEPGVKLKILGYFHLLGTAIIKGKLCQGH